MDILSFILGMCAVLVIVLAIGGVVALFKVLRLEKTFNNISIGFQQQIDLLKKDNESGESFIMTNINQHINEIYKDMDSRLDKMYNKILRDTNPKERILQMIKSGDSSEKKDEHKE